MFRVVERSEWGGLCRYGRSSRQGGLWGPRRRPKSMCRGTVARPNDEVGGASPSRFPPEA